MARKLKNLRNVARLLRSGDSGSLNEGSALSDDPDVIAATMAKPGVVLRRPVGSQGPFRERADLPTHLVDEEPKRRSRRASAKPKKRQSSKRRGRSARPRWRSRRRSAGGTPGARGKRQPGRGSASASVSAAQWPRPKRRSMKLGGSTTRDRRPSRPSATSWSDGRRSRTRAGRSRRKSLRMPCNGRETRYGGARHSNGQKNCRDLLKPSGPSRFFLASPCVAGVPIGLRPVRCPVPARTHLALWRTWL
jgi:hypothetical protein